MSHSEEIPQMVRREIRSPRSAALAGILFALLIITSMILLRTGAITNLAEVDTDWLEERSTAASVILVLIPFAGIAFLWLTGVTRDLLGALEDKFFATVFLGSGIILVVMMFVIRYNQQMAFHPLAKARGAFPASPENRKTCH